jgi:cbb3-type cytochrome oxidase subunit 3
MEGPWFGIVIMTLMVVGLVWWIWRAMKQNKKE